MEGYVENEIIVKRYKYIFNEFGVSRILGGINKSAGTFIKSVLLIFTKF